MIKDPKNERSVDEAALLARSKRFHQEGESAARDVQDPRLISNERSWTSTYEHIVTGRYDALHLLLDGIDVHAVLVLCFETLSGSRTTGQAILKGNDSQAGVLAPLNENLLPFGWHLLGILGVLKDSQSSRNLPYRQIISIAQT